MSSNSASDHHHSHLQEYLKTYVKLMILTAITVSASSFVGGTSGLIVTILISCLKGGLVLAVFMHLKDEDKVYSLIFFASLLFLGLFFIGTQGEWMSRGGVNPEADTYELRKDKLRKEMKQQSSLEQNFKEFLKGDTQSAAPAHARVGVESLL